MNRNLIKPSVNNAVIDDRGNVYQSIRQLSKVIHVKRERVSSALNTKGIFYKDGVSYKLYNSGNSNSVQSDTKPTYTKVNFITKEESKHIDIDDFDMTQIEPEYQEFKKAKEISSLPFVKYDFKLTKRESGTRYCVALFSDVHLGQTIEAESVLGMNQYDTEIAETRVRNYFNNLVSCLNTDHVDNLVFGCLGDIIDGYLRDSALANNELSPLESVMIGQSLIYEGLKFVCENTNIKKILFIGIVGNHGRTTQKTWSVGAYKVNLEWLLYKNVEKFCKIDGLPIEFNIPCADMSVVTMDDGNTFVFFHGEQIRGGNGMAGPVNSLYRHYMKLKRSLDITKFFCGHFHQHIGLSSFTANGCICGMSNFSISNGFPYEEPNQSYELYDSNIGLLLERQIYCD